MQIHTIYYNFLLDLKTGENVLSGTLRIIFF